MLNNSQLSNRLHERISNPLFLTTKLEMEDFLESEIPGNFHCQVTTVAGEDIHFFGLVDNNQPESPITDMKFCAPISGALLGFIDTLVQFCISKHEQTLSQVRMREIDNFLRDNNDQSAVEGGMTPFYPIYSKTIEALREAIVTSSGRRVGEQVSPTIAHDYIESSPRIFDFTQRSFVDDLTIVEKKNIVEEIFDKLVRPFLYQDYGDVDCLFIDGSMVVIEYRGACAQCNKSLTSTMDYIQNVLRLELSEPSMMVITDS